MKKVFTSLLILLTLTTASWGQHFTVVWTGNGVDHVNFYFSKATLNGVDLEAGDEIAVFDGIYCVAAAIVTQPLTSTDLLPMLASRDDEVTTEIIDGYTPNNTISYKIWDISAGLEIDNVTANYTLGTNIFVVSGTVSAELAGILVFDITTEVNPVGGGTTTGDGTHDYNSTATLTAIPATGYNFVNWTETNSGNPVSNELSFDVIVTHDSSYTANFVLQSFTISADPNPTNGGTVSGDGQYDYNTSATLTAIPATGYNFVNWTETNSGNPVSVVSTFNVTVTWDSSFTANFALQTFSINASTNPSQGGTVSGSGTYNFNETAVLTANPATGYDFLNWIETNSGDIVSTNQSFNVSVTRDSSFTANFMLQSFTVNTLANPANGGSVSGNGSYNYNETATLTATPATGYDFINWTATTSGNIASTNQSFEVTVIRDSSFTANFALQSFSITTLVNPTGGGTTSGDGSYNYNETTTLVATPSTNYEFVNWTITNSGNVASGNPSFDVTIISDSSFTANFIRTYSISTTTNPSGSGTISGAGTYTEGSTVNLSTTANEGYSFINWTENSTEVSINPDYSFTATTDRTLIANFIGNQTITFGQVGWHIMSFFVTPPDPDMSVILAPLLSEGSLDKVQNEKGKAFENVSGIGWVNEIGDWSQTEGYKIRVNTNTQLSISGEVITLPNNIPLEAGWNIMSFPSTEMQNSQDMVADLISSGELVKVQDQIGSAIVYFAPNWDYGFLNFNPGEGYKINVNTNTSISIGIPSNKSAIIGQETYAPEHFTPSWTGNGYNHMNIYVLSDNKLEAGDEIAAFDGNVCVGIGVVDPSKDYISVVATMDDQMTTKQDGFIKGNEIQLRIWNKKMNKEYLLENILFHDPDNNKYMESGTSLIHLNLKGLNPIQNYSLGDAYPNPFNNFTTINYSVAEETNVRIEIYNATGQIIKILTDEVRAAGDYTITWDRTSQNGKQISSGTYFYRMTTNNFAEVKTLIYMGR